MQIQFPIHNASWLSSLPILHMQACIWQPNIDFWAMVKDMIKQRKQLAPAL